MQLHDEQPLAHPPRATLWRRWWIRAGIVTLGAACVVAGWQAWPQPQTPPIDRVAPTLTVTPTQELPVAGPTLSSASGSGPTSAVGSVTAPPASKPASPVNPLTGARFYVDPQSRAARQAQQWRSSRPDDAALMDLIAQTPQADWFGDWDGPDIERAVARRVTQIRQAAAVPVLVAYNIHQRDCGHYSAGGVASASDYAHWIRGFAAGIGQRQAVVILEPDALAALECLDSAGQRQRVQALRDAVQVLSQLPHTLVYIDAGTANWLQPTKLAARLREVGIEQAQGFSLNVSNFRSTADLQAYGDQVSALVGGKHYVLDTSRNGQASAGKQWCNPAGQGLGQRPTSSTGRALNDALLWIKHPGNSDGTCNGGPRAGTWWPDYALGLARRARLGG